MANDLVPRLPAAFLLADVAVTIRSAAEHADLAAAGRVQLAAANPFANLGAFVLGDDPLHLQEQVTFRALPQGVVQEYHLQPRTAEFFEQHNLVGKITR
jgi:hypothetical protein